ncbi:uncharacterized protein FIBRA_03467 [Fibroporia radiculosa]|uniref:Xylanolytic transcriptional activator regulatory domain-containing protein n=1 Tax=Fibroporia radiculosa TaxID=599839 RepID=J4I9M4_9APHY|nr:uncharacterized protein FIBRA_03467 [Fibroporia radiculosa]CCM01416.1 predicted protein [Fibroporia radiculosa]
MSKLEEANRKASRRTSASGAPRTELGESVLGAPLPAAFERGTSADVEDWITKARQSIEAFGEYITMGGPGATWDMLGDEGTDDNARSDSEYEIHVEDTDASDAEFSAEGDGESDSLFGELERGRSSSNGPLDGPETPMRRSYLAAAQKPVMLPNESVPLGLIADLSLYKARRRRSSRARSDIDPQDADNTAVGLANDDYFRPSPAPERPIVDEQQQPAILRNGIIKPDEAEKLFGIYYDYMNLSVSLLDPVLYTAQKTYWRSPFLFTVICAIASRHYAPRPELYEQAMKYARLAAGTTLIGGQKTIEAVQAYILLSLYPVPARRWEDDRGFIYLGLAIRVATDLKLHYATTPKPQNELHAREMLNRTRVWLNCFNLDRSTGSQYGQRAIIDNKDYVANHTEFWYEGSPYNLAGFDVHLCCYNAELKVMADFRGRIYSNPEHPTGLNKHIDLAQVCSETDDRLAHLWETWAPRVRKANTDGQSHFRTGLLKLAYSYARLTVLSVGFQHTFGKSSSTTEVPFLWRCYRAASDTVRAVVEEIGIPSQKIYLRHGPEAQSVFVTFASAFLIKLLQPRYHLSREQRVEIRTLVQRVIDLLGSPEVAVDDRHGPKLYSRFLQGLLDTPMARVDHSPPAPRRGSRHPSAVSSPSQPSGASLARQSQSPSSEASSPRPITPPPPPLTAEALSLDQYVQATSSASAAGPAGLLGPSTRQSTPSDIDASGFFSPPLFYDSELLQSMQSVFPDVILPGFNWMGAMQPETQVRHDQPVMGFAGGGPA